jgi:hypothetical protein
MVSTDNSVAGYLFIYFVKDQQLQLHNIQPQVSTNCQIFPIKSVVYDKVNKVENLLVKFGSFV